MDFNEFVVLKDLTKQLIVSPPPKAPPLISPQGTPSKFISIKILDTLKNNTTYIYNFGTSVQDNNEGNILQDFKYVFSTGNYIDSLEQKGTVKNAYSSESLKETKLLLYKKDSSFTDSIIYKQKAHYVASAMDTNFYKFTNLRKGDYLLIALDDKANDYIFDPRSDKIGVYPQTITLPKDSVILSPIYLYKEVLPFTFKRAKQLRKGQLVFGYEGNPKGLNVKLISNVPDDFKSLKYFDKKTDSLNYFYSQIDNDSLNFIVSKDDFIDTVTVFLRKKKLDTIQINSSASSTLEFNDTLFIESNNPIVKIDTSKFYFVDRDTLPVNYRTFISDEKNKVGFQFKKQYKQNYRLQVYPEAIKDIFSFINDSLSVNFRTRDLEDYGNIFVTVENPHKKNILIQLTDNKDFTILSKSINKNGNVNFKNLLPEEYKIRVIYDENNNGKWDSGNYLQKIQPEKVDYIKTVKVRAYFDMVETISIN